MERYWFAQPVYDFELKQYQFLAMMKNFRNDIELKKLFPWFSQLYQLKQDMLSFKKEKTKNSELLQLDLTGINFKTRSLEYEQMPDITELEKVVELIEYATPRLDISIEELAELKQKIYNNLECATVGLYSNYQASGFILLNHASGIYAYKYDRLKVYYHNKVSMSFLSRFGTECSIHAESIRKDLLLEYPGHSTQTWLITGGEALPVEETLAPIVSEIIYELV